MRTALALVAAAALLLVGCSSDDDDGGASDGPDRSAEMSTSGTSITASTSGAGEVIEVSGDTDVAVAVGDTFTLALEANATTGYRWSAQVEGDAVRAAGDEYLAPGDPGVVGQGGTQELTFEAVAAGSATISLTYAQVGSGDVGEAYTVSVTAS